MKKIVLLGSTGSVGRNVLDVIRRYPERFRILAISSNENISLLSEQADAFTPAAAAIGREELAPALRKKIDKKTEVLAGEAGLQKLAALADADLIFMAISGTAALAPLVSALEAGKTVALASKEPMVSAGELIMRIAKRNSAEILPVDSEHSAIFQCLAGRMDREVEKLYITGSGGPLWDRPKDAFHNLSMEEVLSHPKWKMGRKITVDSATLMNKGLEVIEARWLFDIPPERIKVIIHPEAIIHSMVEFVDGTVRASLFCPEMKFPILRALSHPEVIHSDFPRIDFSLLGKLSFQEPDTLRFPALELAYEAIRIGGTMPAVLNRSNEAAVNLFLEGRIKFTQIVQMVRRAVERHSVRDNPSLEDITRAQRWAFEEVLKSC